MLNFGSGLFVKHAFFKLNLFSLSRKVSLLVLLERLLFQKGDS
jgi:hypothetical protein